MGNRIKGHTAESRKRQIEKASAWKKAKQAEGKFGGPGGAGGSGRVSQAVDMPARAVEMQRKGMKTYTPKSQRTIPGVQVETGQAFTERTGREVPDISLQEPEGAAAQREEGIAGYAKGEDPLSRAIDFLILDDIRTLTDPNATPTDKAEAAAWTALSVLPIGKAAKVFNLKSWLKVVIGKTGKNAYKTLPHAKKLKEVFKTAKGKQIGLKQAKAAGRRAARGEFQDKQTQGLLGAIWGKTFKNNPILKIVAGAEAAALTVGIWGFAEAPDPETFNINEIEEYAELMDRLGNTEQAAKAWELYDDSAAFIVELTNPSTIKEILLWSPVGAPVGIYTKWKGLRQRAIFEKRLNDLKRGVNGVGGVSIDEAWNIIKEEDNKVFEENRLTQEEAILKAKAEHAASERTLTDTTLENRRIARREALIEEIRLREESKERMFAIQLEQQIQNQQAWLDYLKRKAELQEETGRSNLGFGLL